jgi:FliG C-terminal domain
MEYDWRYSQKSKCSDWEKLQCMKLIDDLVNLSRMARRNGLLSLIQVAEQGSSFFLKKGLQLVVDGVNPQVVRDIMENYIISGDYDGKDLLERCIILEGVTAIQQGFHPKVTKEFLLSFLGEDNYEIYQKEYGGGSQESLESYLREIEDTPAPSSNGSKLDQVILNLDNDAIEKFLMEINTADLAKSLKGMGGQAQIKIFDNLSKKAAYGLKDSLDNLDSIDDAELSEIQAIIFDIISDIQAQTSNTAAN